MDIEHIRMMFRRGDVVVARHCKDRMKERNISAKQIEEALNNGRIVKEMPKSFPYPKYLIVGMTTKEFPEIPLSLQRDLSSSAVSEIWSI